MGFCSVFGCSNRTDRGNTKQKNGIGFHCFPKDQTLRKLWIQALRRDNWEPNHHSRVCSQHFSNDAIERTYVSGTRLKEGAVPSIFPAYPEHLKKVRKFTRRPRGGDAEVPVVGIASTSNAYVLSGRLQSTEPDELELSEPEELEPTKPPIEDFSVQMNGAITKTVNVQVENKQLSRQVKKLTYVSEQSRVIKKIQRSSSRSSSRIFNMKGKNKEV